MTEETEPTIYEPETDLSYIVGRIEGAYRKETAVGDALFSEKGKLPEELTLEEWEEFLDAVHIFIDKEICKDQSET